MSKLQRNLAGVPKWTAGLAGLVLRRIMAQRLTTGSLAITMPGGARIVNPGFSPGPSAELVLHRWRALRRLLIGGDLGFAEAYLDGDWDSPDLAGFIELAARNFEATEANAEGVLMSRLLRRRRHAARRNSRSGARRNIEAHYDLGNAFYATWLDRGMSYSSALYSEPDMALEAAQDRKQARILELLQPPGGASILEIGCGWGGLAARLAKEGARMTAITLSPAQYQAARAANPEGDIRLMDYRDLRGRFDRIVSIEMLEAVGAAQWQHFFRHFHDLLAPGGRAVLQVITIAEERFETYLSRPDFIQHHIFPGGMLPTVTIMRREIAEAGLRLVAFERFGDSYARTLADWHRRFEAAWAQIQALGFDERFRRKWRYYLQYCEGGFRAGAIDVGLYTVTK
ncbi:MAG TPA: cyclopropane-fatty-acyl-phospholipid synthase family protein [Acetobacteraceae bacterium]|nr:cyclopropane-fatty-acyl-phospholipid synthase family protein [Acetobacteraceae bacterium]